MLRLLSTLPVVFTMSNSIGIVGGGIAGLACGIALHRLGHNVTVYDKVCACLRLVVE